MITDKVVVSCVCMRGNKLVPLEERIMAEDHPQRMTLEDYSSFATPQYLISIARLDVQAANISYPHSLIQLIQGNIFHGLPSDDPYIRTPGHIH